MITSEGQNNRSDAYEEEDAISLLDLMLVFARHKKKIIIVPFLAGCAMAGYSLIVPEIFTASTTLIPSDRKQSSAMAMLSQLGPLAGMAGGAMGGGDTEVLLTMLKSRRIQDKIIASHQLTMSDSEELTLDEARELLAEVTMVSLGRKDGVITVSVKKESPEKAAAIANDYVVELEKLSKELALTEASQRRAFLEKQLADAFAKLQEAEEAMKESQQKSGLVQLDAQGKAVIEAIAALQAQIAAKEVELGALRLFATDENPDVKRIIATISELKNQLSQLERTNPNAQASSLIPSTSQLPEAGIEFLRRTRDLKYAETIHQLLAQQYQMAKVDEAQNAPILQVLDAAIPPEKRSSPKRAQMVLMAMVATGFLMCLVAFMLEAKRQAETDPDQLEKMADLRESLWRL
jgi:tyrosine-protein kinase Etk/Wzc